MYNEVSLQRSGLKKGVFMSTNATHLLHSCLCESPTPPDTTFLSRFEHLNLTSVVKDP